MKKWLLVEAIAGPEKGIAGPLVSNPHVPFRRFVGVNGPEVIESHPDLLKAIAKDCLKQLGGPVAAADKASASALLGSKEPAPKAKASAPATKKEGK